MPLITITPAEGTWVIRAGGAVLGESTRALALTEGDYDPVIYFPREDIAMTFLDRSDRTTTCPHKGIASYYSIVTNNGTIADAVWSYEEAKGSAKPISGYLAFYPDKVAVEQV